MTAILCLAIAAADPGAAWNVLRKNCVPCHFPGKSEGGLSLATAAEAKKGGESGPALVLGNAKRSLLLERAHGRGGDLMPPPKNAVGAGKLTAEELSTLAAWIDAGAAEAPAAPVGKLAAGPASADWRPTYALALSADGTLAAAGRAGDLHLLHVPTQRIVARQAAAHADALHSLALSADGTMLATGGYREIKLWKLAHPEQRVPLAGFPAAVAASAWSADGQRLVAVGADHSLGIWSARTGERLRTVPLAKPVAALAVQAEPFAVAVAGTDGAAQIIGLDKSQDRALKLPAAALAVAWLGGGNLAAACADKKLWTIPKGQAEPAKEALALPGKLSRLTPGPQGGAWAAGDDGVLRLLDPARKQAARAVQMSGKVRDLAVRADGQRLAAASEAGAVRLWNVANGQALGDARGDQAGKRALAAAERGRDLARLSQESAKRQVEEQTKELPAEQKEAESAAKAPEAAKKAVADQRAKLAERTKSREAAEARAKDKKRPDLAEAAKLAKAQEESAAEALANAEAGVKAAERRAGAAKDALAQGQKQFAEAKTRLAKSDAAAKAAEAAAAAAQTAAAKSIPALRTVAFSANGELLATLRADGAIVLWSAEDLRPAGEIPAAGPLAAAPSFGSDGRVQLVGADGTLRRVAAWPEPELLRTLAPANDAAPPHDRIAALAFSPDGKTLASGGGVPAKSGELLLWNLADGTPKALPGHSDTVLSVAFDPDGRRLASASADRFAKVHPLPGGPALAFEGHTHHVLAVAWSPDGRTLVTGGADRRTLRWNAETRERGMRNPPELPEQVAALAWLGVGRNYGAAVGPALRLFGGGGGDRLRELAADPGDFLHAAAASANGKAIAAAGQHGTIYVWNPDTGVRVARMPAP